MESEISTLFTTLITKVDTTLENLLVEQERNNEVIKKLITDNNEKSKTIQQLQDKYEKKPESVYKLDSSNKIIPEKL